MLNKITVSLGERSYPIYISTDYSHLGEVFKKVNSKVLIVTDTNVEKTQAPEFISCLKATGIEPVVYAISPGEKSKNLETISSIYDILLKNNFDRSSTLVALGGGVVGDAAGFAAATYYRGINFVQVPTTLLAQVDSSVGGKVGVDFKDYKNLVGSFYQPKFVYINVNSLKTLPEREIRAGLAEVVKHSIIKSPDLFEYIEYNKDKIFNLDESVLQYLIKENCSIKASIVEQDEREEDGTRELLNFGHTIGHAIESAHGFELLHGECVSIGMMGAFKLAQKLDMVSEEEVIKVQKLFSVLQFRTSFSKVSSEEVFKRISYDKKIKNGKTYFVLPKAIGEIYYLAVEDMNLVKEVVNELGSRG